MLATSSLVRRSVLVVPLLDADAVARSWRHDADAVALDLASEVTRARPVLPDAVATAAKGGAEVFVCIDKARAYAQIKASASEHLTGVIVSGMETASDIHEIEQMLQEREREEGIVDGTLEIFPLISTARGVWNTREVVNASRRVRCTSLDEDGLGRSLGIVASDEFDPFGFSRGRLIVETLAAVKLPLGLGARPREYDGDELLRVADRARNSGFKGALCAFRSWVAACNAAFTPTTQQVEYYRQVRTAFAEGVKRGTAAVPFPGGRMIDVPVDERAKLVIDWWERCTRRDAEKAAAVSRQLQPT